MLLLPESGSARLPATARRVAGGRRQRGGRQERAAVTGRRCAAARASGTPFMGGTRPAQRTTAPLRPNRAPARRHRHPQHHARQLGDHRDGLRRRRWTTSLRSPRPLTLPSTTAVTARRRHARQCLAGLLVHHCERRSDSTAAAQKECTYRNVSKSSSASCARPSNPGILDMRFTCITVRGLWIAP